MSVKIHCCIFGCNKTLCVTSLVNHDWIYRLVFMLAHETIICLYRRVMYATVHATNHRLHSWKALNRVTCTTGLYVQLYFAHIDMHCKEVIVFAANTPLAWRNVARSLSCSVCFLSLSLIATLCISPWGPAGLSLYICMLGVGVWAVQLSVWISNSPGIHQSSLDGNSASWKKWWNTFNCDTDYLWGCPNTIIILQC